jgi:ABC-type bacteriocin/lantibiotic exporter with double-glycine peptidase domain
MVKKGFLTLLLLAIIDSLCYSSSDHLDDLDAFKFTHSKTSTSYCGLYSIYAAAKSIGVDLHLENLVREEYLTGRNGSNTHDLINACQKNGLIAQARYGLAVDDLMLANAPMILHVKPAGG